MIKALIDTVFDVVGWVVALIPGVPSGFRSLDDLADYINGVGPVLLPMTEIKIAFSIVLAFFAVRMVVSLVRLLAVLIHGA